MFRDVWCVCGRMLVCEAFSCMENGKTGVQLEGTSAYVRQHTSASIRMLTYADVADIC
jgi:hypothetical protein